MNAANTARHDALLRATHGTHNLLADLSFQTVYTPELLVRAVDNHREAQALLAKARAMPRTLLGARIHSAALDNADVAHEALESIACTANRAPQLF